MKYGSIETDEETGRVDIAEGTHWEKQHRGVQLQRLHTSPELSVHGFEQVGRPHVGFT